MNIVPGCSSLCRTVAHDPESHYLRGIIDAFVWLSPNIVRTGPLEINFSAHSAFINGMRVSISGREWEVLAYLARRLGVWCPSEEVITAIWGPTWRISPRTKFTHILNCTVYRLRKKFGEAGRLIVTQSSGSFASSGIRLEEVHDAQSVVSDSRERHDPSRPAFMPARKEARDEMFAGFSFGHSTLSETRSHEAEARAHAASR
jgi:DNA-binding winged helix-turn-helix (wHTH) protein